MGNPSLTHQDNTKAAQIVATIINLVPIVWLVLNTQSISMDMKLLVALMVLAITLHEVVEAEPREAKICLDMMESMLPRFCKNCCEKAGYSKVKSHVRPVDVGKAKFERTSECLCLSIDE